MKDIKDNFKVEKNIQRFLIGVICLIILLLIFGIGSRIVNNIIEKREEKILLEAVNQIPNHELLGEYWLGNTDCYSENSNKTSCTAITFNVSKELCLKLEQPYLNQSDKSDPYECFTYAKDKFKDKTLKLYFGNGSERGGYWVRAWIE